MDAKLQICFLLAMLPIVFPYAMDYIELKRYPTKTTITKANQEMSALDSKASSDSFASRVDASEDPYSKENVENNASEDYKNDQNSSKEKTYQVNDSINSEKPKTDPNIKGRRPTFSTALHQDQSPDDITNNERTDARMGSDKAKYNHNGDSISKNKAHYSSFNLDIESEDTDTSPSETRKKYYNNHSLKDKHASRQPKYDDYYPTRDRGVNHRYFFEQTHRQPNQQKHRQLNEQTHRQSNEQTHRQPNEQKHRQPKQRTGRKRKGPNSNRKSKMNKSSNEMSKKYSKQRKPVPDQHNEELRAASIVSRPVVRRPDEPYIASYEEPRSGRGHNEKEGRFHHDHERHQSATGNTRTEPLHEEDKLFMAATGYGRSTRQQFHEQGVQGPHSYKFGYNTGDAFNPMARYEERDTDGYVRGSYSFIDPHGKQQVVHYESHPTLGFRTKGSPGSHQHSGF